MVTDVLYVIFLLFLISYLGIVLIIGILFSIRAYQTRLDNLTYASICFILISISQFGLFLFNFNVLMEEGFRILHYIFAVFFIKSTFYKDRKSAYFYVLSITIINSIILFYLYCQILIQNSPQFHYTAVTIDFITRFTIFIWLTWAAYSAYKEFKNEDIEPWIKTRFKLTAIVSLIVSLYNLNNFFLPWNVRFGDPNNILSFTILGIMSILSLIISIGFFLAWVTPNWYKNYLNKDFEPLEHKEFSEGEMIEIIKYLGDFLAKKTDLSPPAARGAIKLAMKEELDPFKPMNQINYGDMKNVIKNSLKNRLVTLKLQNVELVSKEMLQQLIRGQSLISLANL
jgi:hypothetical protein